MVYQPVYVDANQIESGSLTETFIFEGNDRKEIQK